MIDNNKLAELETQIGLVHDIMRHTDAKDPRMESLRELLAVMYQELIKLQPPRDKLDKPLLSDDSL
jgi:hypothetical protein